MDSSGSSQTQEAGYGEDSKFQGPMKSEKFERTLYFLAESAADYC